MVKRLLLLNLFLFVTFSPVFAYADKIVVVVNNQNAADSLSSDLIGDIYLGRTSRFPTGEPAKPLDLPKGLTITNDFYAKVVKKTPAQLRAHWSRLVFTGKGRPPKRLADELAVKSVISERTDSIGYMYQGTADEAVKVIFDAP